MFNVAPIPGLCNFNSNVYCVYNGVHNFATGQLIYNLVEAHCYSIGMTGQLLSNHVAVERDRNVRRFNCEGLRQLQCIVTDEDLRS